MALKVLKAGGDEPMVYCTRADQGESVAHRVSKQELAACLKINALLAEHVYVSASHLLASDTALEVLESLAPLTETGAIVVGLRDDCPDLRTFATLFLGSRRLSSRSEAGRSIWDRARRAEALVTSAVQWSPPRQQLLFKKSLLSSVQDPRSALRRRLTATLRFSLEEFMRATSDTPEEEFSRRKLRQLALSHIPHRVGAVMREVNLLYYTVGSQKAGLIPDLLPSYFDDVANATKAYLPGRGSPQSETFREMLNALVLPGDIVSRLSSESIVTVRTQYHAEVQRFRKKWWAMLGLGEPSPSGECDQTIHEVLREVVAREAKGLRLHERASRGVSVGRLLVSLASLIPEPTLAALSFAVSLLAAASASDPVKSWVVDSHFHVLGTRLKRTVES